MNVFIIYIYILALTRAYPCTEVGEPEHGEASSFCGQAAVCQKKEEFVWKSGKASRELWSK